MGVGIPYNKVNVLICKRTFFGNESSICGVGTHLIFDVIADKKEEGQKHRNEFKRRKGYWNKKKGGGGQKENLSKKEEKRKRKKKRTGEDQQIE